MTKEIITVPDQLNSENLISFPETEINMILLRSCGLIHSYTRVHPDILLTKKEISEAISYLHIKKINPDKTICIHPGWLQPLSPKSLPVTLVETLITEIEKRYYIPALILGTSEAAYIASTSHIIRNCIKLQIYHLRTLAACLSLCKGVIAADTGIGHLAAASGSNVVSLFGPTSIARCSPSGSGSVQIMYNKHLNCLGCMENGVPSCKKIPPLCMASFIASDILQTLLSTKKDSQIN